MDYFSSKDLSHDFPPNCKISYFLSIFNAPCMCLNIRCDGNFEPNFRSKHNIYIIKNKTQQD
jgi:hypothetical protein